MVGKNLLKLVLLIVVLSLGIFEYSVAFAQINWGQNLGELKGIDFTSEYLFRLLNGITCWFIRFAVIAIGIMLVVYGIMFLQSRGNPTGMANAKKALMFGLVGALVIFGVFTIILTVAAIIGVDFPINNLIQCS